MKFILGYNPVRKSKFYDGPQLYWELKVEHGGLFFEFERVERDDTGVCIPKLRVYESNDYPDKMIHDLLRSKQIVELVAEPNQIKQAG